MSQVREQYRHTWKLHLDLLVPKVGLFPIKPWLLYHLAVAYKSQKPWISRNRSRLSQLKFHAKSGGHPEDRPEDTFKFVPVGAHNNVHTSVHEAGPQGPVPLCLHWICSSFTNSRCSLFWPSPLPIFLSLSPLSPFEPLVKGKSSGELHHQELQSYANATNGARIIHWYHRKSPW